MFVMSGQSNMQGQSESGPLPLELPQYKAYEYKLLTNSLTTVKHPFGEDIGDLLLQAHQGWGSLSPKFAESYYYTSGIPTLMIGASKGGTNLSEWSKVGVGANRYAKLVEKVNNAKIAANANGLTIKSKNLVWLQGESDGIINTTKEDYKQRFLVFWNNLKADCGLEKCFIIRVAKFFEHNVIPIIQAQEELANENSDIIMVTRITGTFTGNPLYMQGIDHYTNMGYDLLGTVAGKNIANYMMGKSIILEEEPYSDMT